MATETGVAGVSKYGSAQWMVEHAAFVASAFANEKPESFENYFAAVQRAAKHLDQEATQRYMNDENALTEHANLMRSIGAYLKLLEGVVPALKIHPECALARMTGAECVGYLEAQVKALTHRLKSLPKTA